ncbi:MAG: hypothetical protein H6626_05990 [Pseudobdellovibrionaceae bacterium]|nr:MAG: hypothetical protein H6626_05990 [Pseudobdellovibrionaceae bacterium]
MTKVLTLVVLLCVSATGFAVEGPCKNFVDAQSQVRAKNLNSDVCLIDESSLTELLTGLAQPETVMGTGIINPDGFTGSMRLTFSLTNEGVESYAVFLQKEEFDMVNPEDEIAVPLLYFISSVVGLGTIGAVYVAVEYGPTVKALLEEYNLTLRSFRQDVHKMAGTMDMMAVDINTMRNQMESLKTEMEGMNIQVAELNRTQLATMNRQMASMNYNMYNVNRQMGQMGNSMDAMSMPMQMMSMPFKMFGF